MGLFSLCTRMRQLQEADFDEMSRINTARITLSSYSFMFRALVVVVADATEGLCTHTPWGL